MRIHTIDLKYRGVREAIASYLVVGPRGPVLVETGPDTTRNRLVASLGEQGFRPSDVRDVLVTHIHLDHSGCAWWWGRNGARVHVHPVGAPHLIDPSKLLASAERIYGDRMGELWGEVRSLPASSVHEVMDGETFEAGGLEFTAIETPGHARHHHAYRLGDLIFTGDSAGIRLPSCAVIDLPAPPPEFDREVWLHTVDRLIDAKPTRIYPTHFGPVDDASEHLFRFKTLLVDSVDRIGDFLAEGSDREEMVSRYESWNRKRWVEAGLPDEKIRRYETANPVSMSVDGILRYLKRQGAS